MPGKVLSKAAHKFLIQKLVIGSNATLVPVSLWTRKRVTTNLSKA